MSLPSRTAILACFCLAALPRLTQAGLVVDPLVGSSTVLTQADYDANNSLIDDQIFNSSFGSLPAGFKFFGTTLSQLAISANGNLTDLNGTDVFFTSSFAQGHATLRIAPLWDDYLFLDPALAPGDPVNQIYENVTSDYYAVTWNNVRLHLESNLPTVFPYSLMSTQIVMFATQTTLRGFQFQPNDIVFGYVSQTGSTGTYSPYLEAEAGLNLNSGTYSRLALPDNLLIDNTIAAAILPWQPNSALLFRPVNDGNGDFVNYNVSTITFAAVPEPMMLSWCLAASGLLALRQRRLRSAVPPAPL